MSSAKRFRQWAEAYREPEPNVFEIGSFARNSIFSIHIVPGSLLISEFMNLFIG
jgi:hypothetical protein